MENGCFQLFVSPLLLFPVFVLSLGDSITYGYGCRAEEAFGYLVARALGGTVLNAGQSGAGLAQMVLLARELIPAYRPDGKPGTITVKSPKHAIAKGLPATFQVKQTEMYNEPFHVPSPDAVIFEETWKSGERFRSGMVWNIGKGKVFYFRPGHETYPVYKQPEVIKVIENACRWLGEHD